MNRRLMDGFSLIEVVLALGVAAFCLLAILGLLSTGLGSNQSAIEQTEAASIARSIAGDLRGIPPGTNTNPQSQYGFYIPLAGQTVPAATNPNTVFFAEGLVPVAGSTTSPSNPAQSISIVSPSVAPLFRADVTFAPPPSGQRTATMARILVTWPALTNPNPTLSAQNYSGSYEVGTALDRN
jgi:uncharacterized protein (TIGR02598 family)